MSFVDKLGLSAPEDISARMDLINSNGEIVRDKKGEAGWIEFFGPESEPVRRFRRHIETEQYLEQEKKKRKGSKLPTPAEAEREVEKMEGQMIEGLSLRVKDWRLVSGDGIEIKEPVTLENAKSLFSSTEYGFLRRAAIEFISDPENFFTKKPETS